MFSVYLRLYPVFIVGKSTVLVVCAYNTRGITVRKGVKDHFYLALFGVYVQPAPG